MLLRTLAGIAALAVVSALVAFAYFRVSERPQKITALWDIKLGESEADVILKKGQPLQKIADGTQWIYRIDDYNGQWATVHFENHKVKVVVLAGSDAHPVLKVQGITHYSTLEAVTDKFGAPTSTSDSADYTSRIVSYKPYNIAFEITLNRVVCVGLFNGAESEGVEFTKEAPTVPAGAPKS